MKNIILEKYKEMLNEDWFTSIKRDGVLVDIFKNQSSKEWKYNHLKMNCQENFFKFYK